MIDVPQIEYRQFDHTPAIGWGVSANGEIMLRCACGVWVLLAAYIWHCSSYDGTCEPALRHGCGFNQMIRLTGYAELHQ